MKRSFLLFSLIFYIGLAVSAQPRLPEKAQIFYPDVLLKSAVVSEKQVRDLEKSSDFGQRTPPANRTFWIVYSDRDDNPTYTEPGGSVKHMNLSLNERLRIAQIKNGYALVYSEPQEDIAFPMISQYAECKGWIPMKKLLLWHSCPSNEAGIYNKALLCVNLDQKTGSELGRLYRNPANKSKYEELVTDMEFYYVMKREGNLSLLSRTHSLDGRSDQMLQGWVSEQSYVSWNQRSCIEPTWDHRDVEYFADENIHANVYHDRNLGNCVTQLRFNRKQSTRYDRHLYRMHPDALRFPILDEGTDALYNCSTFGTAGGDIVVVDEKETREAGSSNAFSEKVLRDKSNINIGIVIDGTKSMAPFYPAVKEAIKEGCKFFGKNYKVKVGVVIYRDYTDGEFLTEKLPLTPPDNPALDKFLDSGGKYGIKSSGSDRTNEEALYAGINEALDRLGFKKEQSNIRLVVGDCGNDRADTRFTSEEIVKKLVDKDVDVMGFQVRRSSADAFELFNDQMLDLMMKSLQKRYAVLNSDIKMQLKETKDGYNLVNDMKSILYVGAHNYPDAGMEMPLTKLTSLMEETILNCSGTIKYKIDLIAAFGAGGFKTNKEKLETGVDIDDEFLKHTLGDHYEQIKNSNSLLAFKGYTQKVHKSGRNFYKPVVFMSSDELNKLIEQLSPVNDAAVVQTNDREPYVNAMKALAQSLIPDELSDAQLGNLEYGEIMKMVNGLNEAPGALKGHTLFEIASPQVVTHVEYASLVDDFQRKFKNLERLKTQPYKFTRTFNGLKYYWLPVEDLP